MKTEVVMHELYPAATAAMSCFVTTGKAPSANVCRLNSSKAA
jgi:hypothetical protein